MKANTYTSEIYGIAKTVCSAAEGQLEQRGYIFLKNNNKASFKILTN